MTFLADGELRQQRVAQEAQFPEPSQQSREVLGAFQKKGGNCEVVAHHQSYEHQAAVSTIR